MSEDIDIDIKVKAEEVEEDDLQVLTVIQLSNKQPARANPNRRSPPEDSANRSLARQQFLAKLSEEERNRRRDEYNAKRRLRRKEKRDAGVTEAEMLEQDRRRRERWNKLSEEERERRRLESNEKRRLRRLAQREAGKTETQLEKEHRIKKRTELGLGSKIRWKRMSDDQLGEEVKRILIEKRDKWKHKVKWQEGPTGKLLMTRKELESVKRNYGRFLQRQRQQEKMSEEEAAQQKQAHNFRQLVRRAHMTEEERKLHRVKQFISRRGLWASKSEDEMREIREKNRADSRQWQRNITAEKKARHAENMRKSAKRWNAKNRDKVAEWYRQKRLNETPEERRQQLLYYRINQAKQKLKRKLAQEGIPQQVIQEELKELERKMRSEPLPPLEQLSTFKPKPRKNPPKPKKKPEGPVRVSQYENNNACTAEPKPLLMTSQSHPIPLTTETEVDGDASSELDHEPLPSAPTSPSPPRFISFQDMAMTNDKDHDDNPLPLLEQDGNQSPIVAIIVQDEHEVRRSIEPSAPVILLTSPETLTSPPRNLPTPTDPDPGHKKCPHCTAAAFPQRTQLQSHICSTHPEKCWRCPKCLIVLASPQDLIPHFKTHHQKNSPVKDEEAEDDPNQNGSGRRRPVRRRSRVSSSPFACMKCPVNRKFETLLKLTAHVQATHPKSFWPCPRCKLLKYSEASLALHCKICRRNLERITMAAEQQNIQNGVANSQKALNGPVCFCGICGKGFTQIVSLRNHTNEVHLQLRSHKCPVCGKRFKRASILNKHRREVHVGI